MMKRPLILIAAILALTALSQTARAESVERQFDEFFRKQEKFSAKDRKKREEGYVLQRYYDPAGQNKGELSLGGGPDPKPVYGGSTNFNFTGNSFENEEGGILNLRLKF